MDQIEKLNQIQIKKKTFKIDYLFCSDWKFLSLIIGIKAANSTYFCPWCMCAKEYRSGLDVDWEKYPRNWHSTENTCFDCLRDECSDELHDVDSSVPSLLKPPFTRDNCILDPLHCLLRTSDLLENVLYEKADQRGLNNLLENFFINNAIPLRIKNIDADLHTVQWSSMNAEERMCLWQRIDLKFIFGNFLDRVTIIVILIPRKHSRK